MEGCILFKTVQGNDPDTFRRQEVHDGQVEEADIKAEECLLKDRGPVQPEEDIPKDTDRDQDSNQDQDIAQGHKA